VTAATFVVPGPPVTWKRARRGKGHSYTDPKDAQHREKIRAHARNAGLRRPLVGRVRLDVAFFTRYDPLDPRSGDLDNYEKAVKDALQGIAFANDRQVCEGGKFKAHDAANPRTEVTVRLAGEPKNAMREWDCAPCAHQANGECLLGLDVPADGCPEFTPLAGHVGGGPDQSIEDAEDAHGERVRAVKADQPG
jgi:Holliday junction resolvase RusA-like endonuclease